MSGGVAYLLDPDPGRVNTEMVDLEPLGRERCDPAPRAGGAAPGGDRLGRGRRGCWPTGSRRWPGSSRSCRKDYKRVLDAASRAEQEGRDVNEAVMAAAHG